MMGFVQAVGTCFRKYFTFAGRASRAEYWWWTLFLFLGSFVYTAVLLVMFNRSGWVDIDEFATTELAMFSAVATAFWLLTVIPTLAVTVRRLHDTGRSGGWILVPWILNAVSCWGALMAQPAALRALGIGGVSGDPVLGGALMIVASIAALIVSIMMFVWMLKRGTPGDNFFGPDPSGGAGSYGEQYARSYVPQVERLATSGAPQMSHREEISALYRQRVLGNQNPRG